MARVPRPQRSPLLRLLRDWLFGALLPVWLLATFLAMFARVDGDSMNPTLRSGDVLVLYKLPRWLRAWGLSPNWPRRGDVIVFKAPPDRPESYETGLFGLRLRPYFIKRVAGVAGDTVELREGYLYRNGKRIAESYTTGDAGQNVAAFVVPKGAVYVLGDNRRLGESVDSRYFGPVSLHDVAGNVGPRLWRGQ